MRILALIWFCVALTTISAEPDPKKFKTEIKDREKQSNSSLTEDEKKFLREVEAKFGIKPEVVAEKEKDVTEEKKNFPTANKTPFPAVIAIEIVNDTDSKSKDKRTIDANLGYGYRTNNGYSYNYFGKPAQDKGKFMIYPYSQEDIPAPNYKTQSSGYDHPHSTYTKTSTKVEIQPSQAFELVTEKQETGYHYEKPEVDFQQSNYNNIKGLVSPPITYSQPENTQGHSTLYTTYNGEQFSGLSGQFPTVMPNYFVDPSQLLRNPEYQNAGLTQDHLRQHGSVLEQRVVPVLVLRIPSSSLKNPTAELFANLPHNYPLSQYLNNVNLQELVNGYFKKMGYPFAPHVMPYQNSHASMADTPTAAPVSNYEPQHYATPYVQPSYTHADYSGVQYSAVQPVMARYPSSYPRKHYVLSHGHSLYQAPQQQQRQRYEYQYQYVPQSAVPSQTYYVHPKYQQQVQAHSGREETDTKVQYEIPSQALNHGSGPSSLEYTASQAGPHYDAGKSAGSSHYESPIVIPSSYGSSKEESSAEVSAEYDPASIQGYQTKDAITPQYYTVQQPEQKEEYSYSSPDSTNTQSFTHDDASVGPQYTYQQQTHEDTENNGLVLSENYPSKDHTIATVLPVSYKNAGKQRTTAAPVQSVSYVTPMPHSYKYQSPYRVMVPQTVFRSPSSEKVSYVNSQSVSASQASLHHDRNPEAEYTVSTHYVPPVSKQRPSFPRNYHSHPKRMVKPDHKAQSSNTSRKYNDKKMTS